MCPAFCRIARHDGHAVVTARQEAVFVGEASAIPARIRINTLESNMLPDSNDVSFAAGWASGGINEEKLEEIVSRIVPSQSAKEKDVEAG